MIDLVIADDQSLIRMALRNLFKNEDDIRLVAEAEDGAAAWEFVQRLKPDVAMLDIRMPGIDGLEVLRRISRDANLAATRVVMITTFEIDEYIFDALSSGAAGFVMKDAAPEDLLRAVRLAAAGDSLLSPDVTRKVISAYAERGTGGARPHPNLADLTDRELEILRWVATGLPNDDIGERLFISPATVRTHVGKLLSKLAARDRAGLVAIAYRSGLDIPEV
ncbi:response regulator [Glycomyces harbinensis]|uniref:DNA-binding response regulator, NarL/FixJ family, contains REC and HTH domains n=1 Tax=Glycomyces harbinensis TaxID=58114 RepID=A0A1G6SJD2_9ACTN|nr:response regulator transcription factor [Glycomyces harbinensis]SDD17040.1 DNA-binding response regulator, NarL/FixJ family, contains REC and HTH domains [Glycomyces harbinensis]